MKTCSVVATAPLCSSSVLLAAALVCAMGFLATLTAAEDSPATAAMASAGNAEMTTKDSQSLKEEYQCPTLQEVEDFCPELSTNVTDLKHTLTGEWQVEFGFVRASTTQAVCPRITFSPASGPCTAFASEFSQQHASNPFPAPSTLRVTPQGLLVAPGTEEPHMKVLLVREPFLILAVCSERKPLNIFGLRRALNDDDHRGASTSDPPSSLSFWMDVHDHYMRLSGPAWFLCARLWVDGDTEYRGRGLDFSASTSR